MANWMTDLRFAARSLARQPGFTAIAAATLALGVCAASTMFSVVNGVLVRKPPFARPEELVVVRNQPPNAPPGFVSASEFLDYRRMAQSVSQVALVQGFNANITGDRPDRVDAVAVSPNFFTLLGVPPYLGRTFVAADERPGFTEIAVISYGVWQRVFGGNPTTIGRKVRLDDDDYTIVGVMPPNFRHPIDKPGAPVEVWLPAGYMGAPWPTTPVRNSRFGDVIARLKPGQTLTTAQFDFDRINKELLATYPTDYGSTMDWKIAVQPLRTVMVGDSGRPLLLLLGAVSFVLLVACTNVASLLLARGAARRTEIAVRAAMGAGRSRIVRTLLTEHLMLAGIGGGAGVLLTIAGVALVRALAPAGLPSRDQIVVDWRVLAFVVVASIVAGLLAGVLPASIGARTPLSEVLKAGGRASTMGGGGRRARSVLVVFELAMSVVLLTGAGLVALSFWKLQQVDLGFAPDHLLTAEITVSLPNDRSQGKYVAPAPRVQFFEEILRRLQALPGVTHVAGTGAVPLRDDATDGPVGVDGRPSMPVGQLPRAVMRRVTPSYFDAMKTSVVRGQPLSAQDRMGMPLNVVISEAMARQIFPNEDPIGKRFKRGPVESQGPWMTVVGVARDAKLRSVDGDPESTIYVSMWQAPPVTLAMLVRTSQDAGALAPQIAQVVHSIDPDQPVYRVTTMESVVVAAMGQRRFAALLLVVFAGLSLALAAVGVYGLVAQSVAHRRREIGVRMAVGADGGAVLRLIVRDAVALAALGTVVGLGLSLGLMRFLSSQLFEVSAREPIVLVIVAPVLLVVAAAAAWGPGRAAANLSPVTALRSE